VDTRWKKPEHKPATTATTSIAQVLPSVKPLSRQNSKNSDLTRKPVSVKSITEKISMQIKKTTSIATSIDYKKTQKVQEKRIENVPLIRSPAKIVAKNTQKQDSGVKFFESHSTYLLYQVSTFLNLSIFETFC
jgi:hypothetical protein